MAVPVLHQLPQVLLPEVYARMADLHPDETFATRLTESASGDVELETITNALFLSHSRKAASHLVEFGCTPRMPGDPQQVVALVASSSYTYFVYEVAAYLLGWIVSHAHLRRR